MRIWKREDSIERELRAQRPEPRRELVDGIVGMVGRSSTRAGRSGRLGLAVALTAAALVALAATGGLSYAASGVANAAKATEHVFVPAKQAAPSGNLGSAQAQYMVTLCFHGHTIRVDSHAKNALLRNGATEGACGGGSFAPRGKQAWMCIAGHNILVNKSEVAKLDRIRGVSRGFCKKK